MEQSPVSFPSGDFKNHHEVLLKLNQHEDNMFNNRLQALIVSTAFLVAAYAQFRNWEPPTIVLRRAICIAGVSLAIVMQIALSRTAVTLEKVIVEIDELEEALHLSYFKRRDTKGPKLWTICDLLGTGIPIGMVILWAFLFADTFKGIWHISLAFFCGICTSLLLRTIADLNKLGTHRSKVKKRKTV